MPTEAASLGSGSGSSASRVVQYRHTCETCGKAFQRATGLERHRRSAHTHENPYACEYCSQTFSRIDLLQRHVSLYHKAMSAHRKDETFDKTIEMLLHSQQINQQRDLLPHVIQSNNWNANPHPPTNTESSSTLPARRASHPQITSSAISFVAPSSSFPAPSTSAPENNDALNNMLQWLSNGVSGDSMMNSNVSSTAEEGYSEVQSKMLSGFGSSPETLNDNPLKMFTSTKAQSNTSTLSMTPPSLSPILEAFATSSSESCITSPGTLFANDNSEQVNENCPVKPRDTSANAPLTSMSQDWPTPEPRHLHLYRVHFSLHLSFIHLPSLDLQIEKGDDLDADIRRAIAIIGGNYESAAQGGLDKGARPLPKSCDYYGCGHLKTKTLRSIEDLQEQALSNQHPSKRVLLRRTQIMILLQLASMFSEDRKHIVAAKISHGSLIAIARELLSEFNQSHTIHAHGSWAEFVEREECVRTLWTVFLVDSLHSFCYQQNPWFSLSELSNIPDLSSDDLWNAVSDSQFHMLQANQSSDIGSSCIFDLVNSLKGEGQSILPKHLSLSGTLLTLLCKVTEIARIVKDDTITRKQLASRVQRVSPLSLSGDETTSIMQAIDSHDIHLRQNLDEADRYLSRWLSLVQFSSSHNRNPSHREASFMADFMPWYWAGVHFIRLLRRRIPNEGKEKKYTSSMPIDQLQSRISPIAQGNGQTHEVQNDPIGIMHLLVRIRLALQGLDGGASMQSAIGKSEIDMALPPLPSTVAICSIIGLFPAKCLSKITI